jgi:hypothetical protein
MGDGSGEMRVARQVTPLGFDRGTGRGVTIHRSPRWGFCAARTRVSKPNKPDAVNLARTLGLRVEHKRRRFADRARWPFVNGEGVLSSSRGLRGT